MTTVLIAEDDTASRELLAAAIRSWGYEPVLCQDGEEAQAVLRQPHPPKLVVLDWMMPGLSGTDICRWVRQEAPELPPYIIMLTSRNGQGDVTAGFAAGADDFVCKPFDPEELHARLDVGSRLVALQAKLAEQVRQLRESMEQVRQLQGIIPICANCKKVRDDKGYWDQVEAYISRHSDARFSHGFCPECYAQFMQELAPPAKR